jgi:hypothetical protein
VGNANFGARENPNAVELYGPDGFLLRDQTKTVAVQWDGNGNLQDYGFTSWSWDVGGYGQRITKTSASTWTIDIYDQGAVVTTNHLPINPPRIPQP